MRVENSREMMEEVSCRGEEHIKRKKRKKERKKERKEEYKKILYN